MIGLNGCAIFSRRIRLRSFGISKSVKSETARAEYAAAWKTLHLMTRKIECRARRAGIIIDNNYGITRMPPS